MNPKALQDQLDALVKRCEWEKIVSFVEQVPLPLTAEWLDVASAIAFALGQLGRTDQAVAVNEAIWEQRPSRRQASSLAYLYYDACLRRQERGAPQRDREADRKAFRRWLAEALSRDEHSIKDLYRLGNFEAQVEAQRDRVALRAFLKAIESYRELSNEERLRRHDLRPYFIKSLYGAARSALRLRQLELARRLIFDCLREDNGRGHVAPLFQLYLAGKICFAIAQKVEEESEQQRWAAHAERALRSALDAPGPHRRNFVFSKLAQLAFWQDRLDDAESWIEENIPVHQRDASVWRLTGEVRHAQGRLNDALFALQNALKRDRSGRHLTLTAMGRLELALKKPKKAERSFRKASDFRRRNYQSAHYPALRGLAEALEARGKTEEANEIKKDLEKRRSRFNDYEEHSMPA